MNRIKRLVVDTTTFVTTVQKSICIHRASEVYTIFSHLRLMKHVADDISIQYTQIFTAVYHLVGIGAYTNTRRLMGTKCVALLSAD
jgi:hypothetical protein